MTKSHDAPEPQRDIGQTLIVSLRKLPRSLGSSEQELLHEMKSIVGDAAIQLRPRFLVCVAIFVAKKAGTCLN